MGATGQRGASHVSECVSDIQDVAGHTLVTSYAVLRPDGEWSVMLVNKDQLNSHSVHIVFADAKGKGDRNFAGPVSVVTFGSEQYQWHSNIKGGIADPNGPPARATITATASTSFNLAKASVTVIRGKLSTDNAK
jgi:hypothetical protein